MKVSTSLVTVLFAFQADAVNVLQGRAHFLSATMLYRSPGVYDIRICRQSAVFKLPNVVHCIFYLFFLSQVVRSMQQVFFWDTFSHLHLGKR